MTAYLAIDFETANEQRASACAVGVVRVEDGAVAAHWESLIDPETDFAPMNVMIHGIDQEAVAGAPTFPTVLERLQAFVRDAEVVVAHNASFDVQVLTASAARYRLDLEPLPFACTRVFARRWWPGWPSYGLAPVVRRLALDEALDGWGHHDALWDAQACAEIARRGFADHGITTWSEAAEAARIRLGIGDGSGYQGCISRHTSSIETVPPDEEDLDTHHPLYARSVCFTGALQLYTRRVAAQAVADVGGHFSPNVTKATDLLVVGTQDLDRVGGDGMSSKMRKAVAMAGAGHQVEIIDEADFYQLLTACA